MSGKEARITDEPGDPRAVIKYPGAKWSTAGWIIDNMPAHDVYLEPFFGSGAVFFTKVPSRVEVLNDRDDQVVNLFRVCRDRPEELMRAVALTPVSLTEHHECHDTQAVGEPVEDARRLLVRSWQSFGGRIFNRAGWRRVYTPSRSMVDDWLGLPERITSVIQRLRMAAIECEDAIKTIERYKDPRTLIYADPPYPFAVRSDKIHDRYYRTEMGEDAEHLALLDALDKSPAMVIVSTYRNDLYDDRLTTWRRVERTANAQGGLERIETLYLNSAAAARAGYQLTIWDALQQEV
jgi:DNA adenine methylase